MYTLEVAILVSLVGVKRIPTVHLACVLMENLISTTGNQQQHSGH